MSIGWKCPECNTCYSPEVKTCGCSNNRNYMPIQPHVCWYCSRHVDNLKYHTCPELERKNNANYGGVQNER